MADIAKLELNGTTYNLKDVEARQSAESAVDSVTGLAETISGVQGDIRDINSAIDGITDDISSLENGVSDNTESIRTLNNSLSSEVVRLTNKIDDNTEEIEHNTARISALNTRVISAESETQEVSDSLAEISEVAYSANDRSVNNGNDIAVLSARIDEITSLPEGSTSGDAELQDIRVDFQGTTHASAGDAVRYCDELNNDAINGYINYSQNSGSIFGQSKNLFNYFDSRNQFNKFRNNSGVITDTNGLFISHPIFVKGGTTYRAFRDNNAYGTNTKVFVVDSTNTIIYDTIIGTTGSFAEGQYLEFTPTYDCFVSLNLGRTSASSSYINKFTCVGTATDYPSGHNPYYDFVPYYVEPFSDFNGKGIELLDNCKADNLINPNDPSVVDDNYFSWSGQYTSLTGYQISAPIFVKKGVPYIVYSPGMGTNRSIGVCDEDGNIYATFAGVQGDYEDASVNKFTPEFSGYIRVNMGNQGGMLCEERFFEGYRKEFGFTLTGLKNTNDNPNNPLNGKIISFNGDSICAGAGSAGGYGAIIANRNNMVYENIAVSGATITAGTYYDGGSPRHWVCDTIDDMRSDADYIILEGGVNDTVAPLGTVPSATDYTSSFNDSEYATAFELMLKRAVERFPGKKIGYIAVHKMTNRYSSSNNDSNNLYWIAINACKKWGIPVCDLNVNAPALGFIPSLKSAYTYNGDGWHPNEAGYKAYYVDQIEAWLKTL